MLWTGVADSYLKRPTDIPGRQKRTQRSCPFGLERYRAQLAEILIRVA